MTEIIESRKASLDILAIIASFLVVLLHQAAQIESPSIYIYRIMAEVAVPLFVMKSGALLLSKSKKLDYTYVRNRIVRTALIIVFWGLCYNWLCNALIGGISSSIIWKSLMAVVTADVTYNYQFWYLYMLLGLYVISPVIKKFSDNASKRDFLYVIILFSLVGFIIPFLCGISAIDLRSVWVVRWLSPFSAYLLLYYILGTYLDRYPLNKRQCRVLFLLTILLGALTLLKCSGESSQERIGVWLSYSSPFTLVYAVALFSLIYGKKALHTEKGISGLAKYSLGVYILHPAMIVAMRKLLGIDVTCFAPAISVPVLTCVVYVGCVFATWLIKKIPIIRRVV